MLIFTQKSVLWGGKASRTGGFFADREMASLAGKLGGQISRRGKGKLNPELAAKARREFNAAYDHLMKVHKAANPGK